MQPTVKHDSARGANNSAHPHSENDLYTVADFLIATREEPTFRIVRDEQPDFHLSQVYSANEVQILIWDMRVRFDEIAVQSGVPLDDYVAAQLENNPTDAAATARAWLLDQGEQYSPRKSVNVAREFIAHCEPAFGFSTDCDLDDQLGNIEWVWEKYIPRGFVTALVAEQDTGKSTVAQNLCQTVLISGRWPDGQTCNIRAEKLLWIDTDGNLPLFHQRLRDWKMPRGRFVFPPDSLQELAIDNSENWRWIERAIETFNIPLIIIDALSGSHNGKSNDEDSMKIIMKRLHALAQKYKIAVVVLHHLNKAPFGQMTYPITIDRMRGSGAISQYCRSILALTAPDPTRPDERRLDVIKLNLAKKPAPVGYTLTDIGPCWGTAPEPMPPKRAADEAADWLGEALTDGQRPANELRDEGIAKGFSDFAIREARKTLGVKAIKSREGKNAGWLWELENHDAP